MSDTYHGTLSGYTNHDCRCDQCRQAARAYNIQRRVPCVSCGAPVYRRARSEQRYCRKCFAEYLTIPIEQRHGTEVGYSKGCRCMDCRAAAAQARRNRRRQNPEARERENQKRMERYYAAKQSEGAAQS